MDEPEVVRDILTGVHTHYRNGMKCGVRPVKDLTFGKSGREPKTVTYKLTEVRDHTCTCGKTVE